MNYAEAREMFEAAEKAGVLHYLNHNYRQDTGGCIRQAAD